VHPHCGAATYVFVEGEKLIPITRFIDVEALFSLLDKIVNKIEEKRIVGKVEAIAKLVKELPEVIDIKKAPKSINVLKLLTEVFKEGTHEALAEFHHKSLFIGCMHFQDAYNFDLERVQRCGIHYAIPDGRIIPFCSYNTIHRETVEKKFAKKI